jgi:hypothetical protein
MLNFVWVVVFAPVSASADCKSADGCWMAQNLQTRVEPESDCLHISVTDDRCDCTAWVTIDNQCNAPLEARNFSFGLCRIEAEGPTSDCPEILPFDSWGNVYLPLQARTESGHFEEDLWLNLEGDRQDVWVEYDMKKVTTGVGCSGSGLRADWSMWLLWFGLALWRLRPFISRTS